MEEPVTKKREFSMGVVVNSVDIMFEIFFCIPLISIFQYRLVSKLWNSLLSDPKFIITWMKIYNYTPWTALIHDSSLSIEEDLSISSPKRWSGFMSNFDGFSFEFLSSEIFPAKLYMLASNNGLVLCATTKHCHRKYYVCNPLMKAWVSLPEPPTYTNMVHCGLVSNASLASTATKGYSVIRIPRFAAPRTTFSIEIFCSKSGEWNTYEILCSQEVSMPHWLPLQNNITAHDGILYWIEGRGKIITCDVKKHSKDGNGSNTCHCGFIILPIEVEVTKRTQQCLGEIDGKIVLAYSGGYPSEIWRLEDNNNWISISKNIGYGYKTLAFDSINKNFVMMGQKGIINAYNLRTETCDRFEGSCESNSRSTYRMVVLVPLPTPV